MSILDRAEKANDKMTQGQREATERAAAHAEMIRRNKEANAARLGPSDEERAELLRACTDYDPAALRRQVVEAGERLRVALAETPALQAIVDLMLAMGAEHQAAARYRDNAELAGIPAAGRKRTSDQYVDDSGRPWPSLDDLPMHLLRALLLDAGNGR